MNSALRQKPDEERDAEIAHDKIILANVLKAMNEPDHFEPEPEPTGAAAAYVLLGACATVSFGLGALIVWWL